MRIFQIDGDTEHDTKKIIEYAKNNITDKHKAKLMILGDLPCIGEIPDHVLHIHDGYRVVFSIEQHEFLCNHISISIENEHAFPHPYAVKRILKLFNMNQDLESSLHTWKEEEIIAINVNDIGKKKKINAINILQKREEE